VATVSGYDLSTYAGRQQARDENPGSIVDASSIYNPGTGVQTGGTSSGGGGGGGGGGSPNLGALAGAFNVAGAQQQKSLDEQKREFDANLQFQKDQMEKMGIPQVVINQRLAQLQQDEFVFQSQMAQQDQALQQAQILGYYQPPNITNPLDPSLSGTNMSQALGAAGASPTLTPNAAGATVNGLPAGAIPTLAAQAQWAQLFGQNGAPSAGQQTLAALQQAAEMTGMFNGQQTQAAQLQAFNEAMQQQGMGLQALQMASQLQGPQNWVQAANFARGVSNSNIPVFLQNMLSGTTSPAAVGGSGLSNPLTLGSLAASLGAGKMSGPGNGNPNLMQLDAAGAPGAAAAGGATGNSEQDRMFQMARDMFTQGGGALAPQTMESMTPTEKQMLQSLGGAVGADMPTFLQQYANSRIGQGAAQAA